MIGLPERWERDVALGHTRVLGICRVSILKDEVSRDEIN